MELNPLFDTALEAAIDAGIAVKAIYNSKDYEIEIKADESPVTKADKTSSAIIARYLLKSNFPVIDEENCCPDYSIRQNWKYLWLVDPMDGTKEFISGNGEFTMNIAFVEEGKPVFGVIYAPVTGLLYWGGKTTGSFKLENVFSWPGISEVKRNAVALKPIEHTDGKLRIAASRSHLDSNTKNFIDDLKQNNDVEYVSKGSSLKLCMIAEGTTDIYPRFSRTMEWDTAAGHAIVSGTGGVLLKANSQDELTYNKNDISNPGFVAYSGMYVKNDESILE
jgi:3'(2'), 5'-bisphosphate nucleotidase